MRPQGLPEVPAMTAAVAAAAFADGSLAMRADGSLAMRAGDELAGVFADEPFAEAFGVRGTAGLSPGMLALVTVLQFTESPTDRRAAAVAVRAIDWKYALVRHEAPLLRARVRGPCRWSVGLCSADSGFLIV
jgi:hypothetical protein